MATRLDVRGYMSKCRFVVCEGVEQFPRSRVYKGLQQLDKNWTGLPRPSEAIEGLKKVCKGLLVSL